jgi:hypothetical protein
MKFFLLNSSSAHGAESRKLVLFHSGEIFTVVKTPIFGLTGKALPL